VKFFHPGRGFDPDHTVFPKITYYGLDVVVVVVVSLGELPLLHVVVFCLCTAPSEDVVVFFCTTAPLPQLVVVVWLVAGAVASAGATTTGGGICTTGGGASITGAGTVSTSFVEEKHPERSPPTIMNMTIDEICTFKRIGLTSLSIYLSSQLFMQVNFTDR
jgi:hypothetical protein